MKAYVLGGFGLDNLAVKDVAPPEVGEHEVLVQVKAISLNARDLSTIEGRYNPRLQFPMTPGSDAAGTVVEVGRNVTRHKIGDRVVGAFMQGWVDGPYSYEKSKTSLGGPLPGVFSELVALHELASVAIPDGMTFEEASCFPCAGVTAWNALGEYDPIKEGEVLLTLGSGGVSLFAIQLGVLLGAKVAFTSSSPEKIERLKSLGATWAIDVNEFPHWGKVVRETTGGANRVVELGGGGTMAQSIDSCAFNGRIQVIGALAGLTGDVPIGSILHKGLQLRGIYVGSAAMLAKVIQKFHAAGLKPIVDQTFGFSEAPQAFEELRRGRHVGKLVVLGPP